MTEEQKAAIKKMVESLYYLSQDYDASFNGVASVCETALDYYYNAFSEDFIEIEPLFKD